MAVRSDSDLVSLDERRRGRLELDLFALDSVRGQLPAIRVDPAARNSSTCTSESKMQDPAIRAVSASNGPWTLALPADLNSAVLIGFPVTTPLPRILIDSSLSFVPNPEKSTARIASPTA